MYIQFISNGYHPEVKVDMTSIINLKQYSLHTHAVIQLSSLRQYLFLSKISALSFTVTLPPINQRKRAELFATE